MIMQEGLLDTSVIISLEAGRPVDFGALPLNQFVSSISLGELHFGIHSAPNPEARSLRMATFESLAGLAVLTIDSAASLHWGRLRYRLKEAGRKINVNDLWIAAIALANDLPVVTQDGDFDRLLDLGGPAVIHV